MLKSVKELLKRVVGHWIQALAGTAMALLGLVGDIREWDVPGWIWVSASSVMFLWAILRAFHDVRLERDKAIDEASDKRNVEKILESLTARYHFGVHELRHMAPPAGAERDHDFLQEFKLWSAAVKGWNEVVFQEMSDMGCTPSEIARFWTIDEVTGPMMIRGDQWEVALRLHQERCKRLWSVIEIYEAKFESRSRASSA